MVFCISSPTDLIDIRWLIFNTSISLRLRPDVFLLLLRNEAFAVMSSSDGHDNELINGVSIDFDFGFCVGAI